MVGALQHLVKDEKWKSRTMLHPGADGASYSERYRPTGLLSFRRAGARVAPYDTRNRELAPSREHPSRPGSRLEGRPPVRKAYLTAALMLSVCLGWMASVPSAHGQQYTIRPG